MAKAKAKWTDKYTVVGIVPGKVYLHKIGEVDLSNENLPIALVDKLFEAKCSYLKLKKVKVDTKA